MSSPRMDKRNRFPSQQADAPHACSRRAVLAGTATAAVAMATAASSATQTVPARAADIWSGEY